MKYKPTNPETKKQLSWEQRRVNLSRLESPKEESKGYRDTRLILPVHIQQNYHASRHCYGGGR